MGAARSLGPSRIARLLILAAGLLIAFQTARVFQSYSKVWVATVWKHRALSSYDRSALFMLGSEGAPYMQFLNTWIEPGAPVVVPEGGGRFSEQNTLQFYLMPRGIPGCGCDPELFPSADAACAACLQNPALVLPAINEFPPADVSLEGKVFIPYPAGGDKYRGVYLPANGSTGPFTPTQPKGLAPWAAALVDGGILLGLLVLGTLVILCLVPSAGLEEGLSAGFPIGLALLTWGVFVLSWAGARVTFGLFVAVWIGGVLAAVIILRRLRGMRPGTIVHNYAGQVRQAIGSLSLTRALLVAAACFLLAQMVVISVGRSYSLFDAIANWALKGYAIAMEGTIFAGRDWGGHALAYPQNLHLGIAMFRLADGDALPGSKLIDPLFIVSLLFGTFRFWKREHVPTDLALAGSLVLLSVPVIFFHGTIGYANLGYTTYLVLGCLWVLEGVTENRAGPLALGSLLLAGAAWTRPEGVLTASFHGLVVTAACILVLRSRPRPIPALLPFAIIAGTWLAFGLPYIRGDTTGGLISRFLSDLVAGRQGLEPVRNVIDYASKRLFLLNKWGLLVPLTFVLALAGIPRALRKGWRQATPLLSLLVVGVGLPGIILSVAGYTWRSFLNDAFDRAWLPAAIIGFVVTWQMTTSRLGWHARPGLVQEPAAPGTAEPPPLSDAAQYADS